MNRKFIIVALDGGAGSGKSTTAHSLSKSLNLLHVDTGSHYRALTKAFLDVKVDPEQVSAYLNKNNLPLGTEIEEGRSYLLLEGKRFENSVLRSPEINRSVSDYASQSCIRELLFEYQRSQIEIARHNKFDGLVMEGRDIGTVILPDADLKLFLEADPAIRARRRISDGESDQIASRDQKDSTRKIAPLIAADGSLRIDTGSLGIEEVTGLILDVIEKLP